ncbi:hypothetical protein I302_100393 [Kwoniella bestiolae CBS 10118]|uniref:Uncharacterized protein n=1 Tax=Kwoniella bestiolae CBS 10118 TaxID=1296100 RepID=A0A1B9G516_9TREE|nr:hypothetical protein I302_03767 [Kwoniella bestiolae CBS 10118]OCF26090.1 hypothetical protein I302_03767 [Kwoniella bestiolae CBS 10118]
MNRIFTILSHHYRNTDLYRDFLSEILTDPQSSSISVIPYVHKKPKIKINMVNAKLLGGWGNSKSDGKLLKDMYECITDKPSVKKRKIEEI